MKGTILRSVAAVRRQWAYLRARKSFSFMGAQWVVDDGVVNPSLISISRHFAQKAIKHIPPDAKTALELGTGCGMTAILLAKNGLKVTAVDISSLALENAIANAKRNTVEVDFLRSDWDSALAEGQTFDYVVANPPYLQSEKDQAFSAGSDLDQLRACYRAVQRRLAPDGWALLVSSSWSGRQQVLEGFNISGITIRKTARKFYGNERIFFDLCQAMPCV